MLRRALVSAAAVLALAAPAQAFDTAPHADLTRDALTAEGFSPAAASVGVVDNWLVDYYTNPGKNPYSGHAGALIGVTRLGFDREDWLWQWVDGARKLHFDAELRKLEMPNLSSIAGIEHEWRRLRFIAQRQLRYAGQQDDPLLVLAVIGSSLHSVQDFYAHSNWVEPPSDDAGRGGPGVASLGYGDHPTFFDVPPEVRATLVGDDRGVFTGVKGTVRQHGHWRSNKNKSLRGGLNKDWPGRPYYDDAYITAYFATRQWVRALRTWLGNEPLWQRAMALAPTGELSHDLRGAELISAHSGHWQGGGEPCVPFSCGVRTGKAGSVVSLRLAIGDYHDRGPTRYRRAFNDLIGGWRDYPAPATLQAAADIPSSRTDQLFTRFVKLEVLDYRGIDLGDIPGEADVYAHAGIGGQPYSSTVINGEDSFRFPGVYAPFEWLRAVPVQNARTEPVTTMTVRIETGDKRGAGTDDDVFLRLSPTLRLGLDKRAYDDFERDDDDTYSVPITAAIKRGLSVGDIDRVAIEKSRDGVAGGWHLQGVTLTVNGRVLVRDRAIDRWLEDDSRSWTAPGFVRDARTADVVPVWLQLFDDDFGNNDTGDINPFDRVTPFPIGYVLGTTRRGTVTGDDRLKGRLSLENGDRARLTYRLGTLTVTPPPLPAPEPTPSPQPTPTPGPTAPPGAPDLWVPSLTAESVTVANQGDGAAGPFNLVIRRNGAILTTFRIDGLAAGASTSRSYTTACEFQYDATADWDNEVAETNDSNNGRSFAFEFC